MDPRKVIKDAFPELIIKKQFEFASKNVFVLSSAKPKDTNYDNFFLVSVNSDGIIEDFDMKTAVKYPKEFRAAMNSA